MLSLCFEDAVVGIIEDVNTRKKHEFARRLKHIDSLKKENQD